MKIFYVGSKCGYQKIQRNFSNIRSKIKRIILLVVVAFTFRLIESKAADGIEFVNSTPVIHRSVKSLTYKAEVVTNPNFNQYKRSDKIQLPAFSKIRSEFKDLAPFIFLNELNKNIFYKIFNTKDGHTGKYSRLLILAIMIFLLIQDSEAFASA